MRINRILFWGICFFFLMCLLVYLLFPDIGNYSGPTEAIFVLSSFMPVLALIYTLKIYGFDRGHGKALFFIFLSFAALFIGEVIWAIYDFLDVDPFPSIADYFYILSYPLLFIGLFEELEMSKVKWSSNSRLSKVLMGLVGFFLVVLVFYFGIYLAYDPEVTLFENVVAMLYSVGDLVLIGLALFVLRIMNEFQGGLFFYSWLSVFIGLFLTLIADIAFSIYNAPYEEGIFVYNVILDGVWMAAYLSFAYGFASMANIVKLVQDRAKIKAT